ncbi:phosphoribosyltransferase family protein [Chitinophaga nivalis]|uniref:Phosphoribosyltransferase family protein n=1 Tax=Chitinophaga nivalis TaxID=2991709 RepID=A0ABT3IMZ6_9BACT|nr:phosphoribosyltransferase family protein [Chitinophaga nivalis]MCW3464975.1 phosphoribosyltransferase family protein [Chitinophaga nivalis]MCW3485333.1 phosphoribosyltransferase family protein [Chitinophaga nivalis]
MEARYSRYKIDDPDSCPFSELAYSRFKFGDIAYAEKFAEELFAGFIAQYSNLVLAHESIILLPSPYHTIPTASGFLCTFFKKHLNRFLFRNGKAACQEGKIHRMQTYVEDYGNMNYAQRVTLIAHDTYYLDRDFLAGKLCLFLDDIKITGSHEHTVRKILKQYAVSGTFLFLYYAELRNTSIHPRIENYYNYFAVKSAQDIIRIMYGRSFHFNTRVVKYILLMNDADFTLVMQSISPMQRRELLDLAISNNYHQIKAYQKNILNLKPDTSCQLT